MSPNPTPASPRVSCVMLTIPSRRAFLAKAVAAFHAQTWENKELIIVDEPVVTDAIFGDANVTVHVHDSLKSGVTIGAKRNFGASVSRGEIIAHMDDDDFYAPGYIADHVARLIETGKSVSGFHSAVFSDGARRWKYSGHPYWAFDATLCYRREFWQAHPFDELNDGLEGRFRTAAVQARDFTFVDGRDLIEVSIHDGNTSKRVIGEGWTEIEPSETVQTSANAETV